MVFKKILTLQTKKATIQVYPQLIMINGTKFENKTHLCVCNSIEKRQQSSCFQLEKSTGIIIYFPIHVIEVNGYDPSTNTLYGKTFRGNIIRIDIYGKKPVGIVTKDKWSSVIDTSTFQMNS
nr:unnamed protein product [Hydra vulgaris]